MRLCKQTELNKLNQTLFRRTGTAISYFKKLDQNNLL